MPGPVEPSEDVVAMLMADHVELTELLVGLEPGAAPLEERAARLEVLVASLVRHSVAEEEYLYPAAREAMPEGEGITDRGLAAHVGAEETMKRLSEVDPADPQFDPLMAELVSRIREHLAVEEEELFPLLRERLDPAERRRLAVLVRMARDAAPTRPRPGGPHKPPWNLLLAPGIGLLDQMRDALSSRPTSPEDLPPDPPDPPVPADPRNPR